MPEATRRPRVWLCETWEERDALVRQYGKEHLRITVVEEIDEFDIMQTKYRVEEIVPPETPADVGR